MFLKTYNKIIIIIKSFNKEKRPRKCLIMAHLYGYLDILHMQVLWLESNYYNNSITMA